MSSLSSGVDPEIYRLLSAFEYIQILTLGILTWEILVTLPREISLYRSHGVNKTLLLLSFSRYYTLFCTVLDVALNLVDGATLDFCHRIRWVLPFLSTTIQFASVPLLLLRTYAIWHRNNLLSYILVIFWVAPLIIGTYVSTTYEGIPYSEFVGLDVVGGCGNDPTNKWGTVPFVLNLAVDSAIFLLILGRLLFVQSSTTTLRRLLLRDGVIYYLAVVVVNVVNIVFFLAPGLPPLARPLIATPATIIPAIMVGRLYFNLTSNFLPGYETSGSSRSNPQRSVHQSYPLAPRVNITSDMGTRSDIYPLGPMNVKYTVEVTEDSAPPDPNSKGGYESV